MRVLAPGNRGAEGEEQGKGVTVRWGAEGGGKPNPNARGDVQEPDLRCGTTRDERARDRDVLHPQRGVLYKSGAYAPNVLCLTLGDLPAVRRMGLRPGEPDLTGRQTSAAGIGCARQRRAQVG